MLVGHIAIIDTKDVPAELRVKTVAPDSDVPLLAVEGRQRIVFEAIKRIWSQV
jgi:hypothetical protein